VKRVLKSIVLAKNIHTFAYRNFSCCMSRGRAVFTWCDCWCAEAKRLRIVQSN